MDKTLADYVRRISEEMKKRGTFLVPTLIILEEIITDPDAPVYAVTKAKAIAAERRIRLRKAYQSGVKFALGTDATSDIHGRNGEEFRYMVEILGVTPMEAIQIGTKNGAELLGIDQELGTIESGKIADLVAVPGNPLKDINLLAHPDFVMKGGAVVKASGK